MYSKYGTGQDLCSKIDLFCPFLWDRFGSVWFGSVLFGLGVSCLLSLFLFFLWRVFRIANFVKNACVLLSPKCQEHFYFSVFRIANTWYDLRMFFRAVFRTLITASVIRTLFYEHSRLAKMCPEFFCMGR